MQIFYFEIEGKFLKEIKKIWVTENANYKIWLDYWEKIRIDL